MQRYTLKELATLTSSEIYGDENTIITDVGDLESALSHSISFLSNRRYLLAMQKSKAAAIFVSKDISPIPGRNFLFNENPSLAFQKTCELFHPHKLKKSGFIGIDPTASIHRSVKLGSNVTIGPYTVIEEGCIIGDNAHISAHVYMGLHVEIGRDCYIFPHVTLREHTQLHNGVIIQPGAVIGSCGFGFATDEKGMHTKLEQIGHVVIEDHVEVGANATIDRGRFSETRIRKGTKIDNLVQIAHNADIGENNLIVAQSGIAGSSKTGRSVVMGGQSALIGHLKIADATMIAARGAASKSVEEPGGKYAGAPMIPLAEHNKQSVYLRNIAKYVKRIEQLEKALEKLESRQNTPSTK